ncbi:Ribonuclease H1 [Halotydeus destructor]|nr:Ribonuclease H1 [Halotydeus destructor]
MSIEVYIDGSCLNNGRENAQAGVGGYCKEDERMSFSLHLASGRPTNNQAEIFAATAALHRAAKYGYRAVTLVTDSEFLIKAVREWIPIWKTNGWRTSDGRDVVNRDEFELLLDASKDISVSYRFVAGHSGDPGNDEADRRAKAAAIKYRF